MRIAAFGGAYSNPFALEAVLADARERGCERIFNLGDLGGFGADPNALWSLLTEHGVESIAGNYDIAIGRDDEDCGCGYASELDNRYAQVMYDHTRRVTDPAFAAWMRGLPAEHREDIGGCDVHMVHGSPLATNDFFWESLDDDEARLRLTGCDVLLCTHTGIAWQRRVDDTLVVNVGAVGRPANDGRRDVWYAVLDVDAGEARAELVPVAYDWHAQAAAMRAAQLPEAFVETIETGWWTTCLEIVPPAERARGRFQLYRDSLPELGQGGRPVVELFGTALFPPRLWVYSNFHCNLECTYCVVASSPRARPREIAGDRFRALVDEAVAEGFTELYVTGGEPFVHAEMTAMASYAAQRLDTVVLTNAMLFRGRRRDELARLADCPRLVLQVSVDGARPVTHDRWRGAGSWERTMEGIVRARELGIAVRVGMTETPENREEVAELVELLAGMGIPADDFGVRPMVARGFAADVPDGLEVSDAVMVPELTVTADGVHWHPVGGDVGASPDLLLARGDVPLAEAKRLVTQRFLELRQADGSIPAGYRCAI